MRHAWLSVLLILFPTCIPAQTGATAQAVSSDPQAVVLTKQAVLALAAGVPITDVTLTGSAARIAGSDQQSGTVTLKARGTTQSRVDLAFSTPAREIHNDPSSADSYFYGSDQTWHSIASHNCWTDAVWFFPALSALATVGNPGVQFTYIGQETRNGSAVQHIRVSRQVASKSAAATQLIGHLSTSDFYLDSASLLPVAVAFSVHPDNNASLDIPVEIQFSDYRNVNGMEIPYRIRKLIQNNPSLDIAVSAVTANSGLPDSDFAVP